MAESEEELKKLLMKVKEEWKSWLKTQHSQGAQGWCTVMTLRDGMGRQVGMGVQDGEHMYTHGWFMLMYGKSHYNTVK